MKLNDALAPVADDGLLAPLVGSWAQDKHRLVGMYATLFARAMRGKWDSLVYLDLFAGAGRCRIRNTDRFCRTSPTVVLSLDEKFDQYIFCDASPENFVALQARTERDFPSHCVAILQGDANLKGTDICGLVPERALAFCFLDPYKMDNLKFSLIKTLVARRMDFLVLIPSGSDANRNEALYLRPPNRVVADFCGTDDWRTRWQPAGKAAGTFEGFVVREFGRSMKSLGYIDPGMEQANLMRSDEKNLPLYRLVLYSKSALGARFWRETQKYADPQMDLL